MHLWEQDLNPLKETKSILVTWEQREKPKWDDFQKEAAIKQIRILKSFERDTKFVAVVDAENEKELMEIINRV